MPRSIPALDLPYEAEPLPTYRRDGLVPQEARRGRAPRPPRPSWPRSSTSTLTDYALALAAGRSRALSEPDRSGSSISCASTRVYPAEYIRKANLRVHGRRFEKGPAGLEANMTTGRLDTRFAGPAIEPLA